MINRLVMLLACVSLWLVNVTQAADIKGVRLWRAPDNTRLVFDLSGPVDHKIFELENPDRLVIDIKQAKLKSALSELTLSNTPINKVRHGKRNGRDLRVVLDLKTAVRPRSFVLKPNQTYGDRLVIDLYDRNVKPIVKSAPQVAITSSGRVGRDIIIAVDAGHGGDDPGAIGYRGLREKDVVLKIARRLHQLFAREPGFKSFLVREGDYYVGLRQRTVIARQRRADLFVSIHADAFKNRRANGASVFAISQRGATSETARWLASRENSSDLIGGVGNVSLSDKDATLAGVLLDLSMTATLTSSLEAGGQVLRQMGQISRLHKRHVEQAGFMVLKSPDIPSILVETGFITNPIDGKKLGTGSHQERVAQAVFNGIKKYFYQSPPANTYVAQLKQRGPIRGGPTRYVIQRGDTLSEIASRYNVSVSSLRSRNKLKADRIRIGQILHIPN
ncbi:N-acetylmuramoyl-L-alanine amidase [Zooshikella ganghwensis]|uniref:N-acetylmuramoyl-L-alanine amidase n=1 Tax=Zooshikella ganghwensis TaxID=202772 RepID=UPI000416467A|nr:N-acetylmuramoyl-L-alanine amidase [Zooshikella ganghwensis]